MAEKLTWDDAGKIGVLLARRYPRLSPLATDLNDLRRMVSELAEFNADAGSCDQEQLEAIRTAWNEEFLERTQ